MTWPEAIILGVVQGLTEFLPISSTAHLVVVRTALGHPHVEDGFTTIIQLGTLVAVLLYFARDLGQLALALVHDFRTFSWGQSPQSRLAWRILLGSIPVMVAGLLLKSWLKATFYNLTAMGLVSILFAGLMVAAEFTRRRYQARGALREIDELTRWQAVWIGFWQALALMPGASRSGTTITGATFAGLSRAAAARFSFLLSLPSILAAGLKECYDEYKLFQNPSLQDRPSLLAQEDQLLSLGLGLLVSAVVGYLAIWGLMAFLRNYGLWGFVAYRLILGAVLLVWATQLGL